MDPYEAKFRLGRITTTPDALAELAQEDILLAIQRHQSGDWGDLDGADKAENQRALSQGGRLVSVYRSLLGVKFTITTEADRQTSTVDLYRHCERRIVPICEPPKQTEYRPAVRTLQIEKDGDFWRKRIKPKIRIMGKWLERAGFQPGTRVQVTCLAPGVIELRSSSASTGAETKQATPEPSHQPF
jgi:hypothetical protein